MRLKIIPVFAKGFMAMSNALFDAVLREKDPMYDCAIITPENGIEYWKYECCNNANNSHSVTKFFVATTIGILRDRGMIDINAPVTSFFDESAFPDDFDEKWNKVTVYDAMRHKTGMDIIPYGVDDDNCTPKIGDDFLKYIFSLKLAYERDEYRRYSDAAYYLLMRIIGSVTGAPADEFMRENIFNPLEFRQWSMAKCPKGHPIGGGGFFARSDDVAKLGFAYANDGIYNGKRIVSKEWTDLAMANDFACTSHRGTDVYVKTGAMGQIVAFTKERKAACAWHGCSPKDGNARNDRLLDAFLEFLDARR